MKTKKFLSIVLSIVMVLALCPCALAADSQANATQLKDHIRFSNLSQLATGDSVQREVETDGGTAVVGISKEQGYARAGGETWRVWYQGINISAEFYMTVANNRVTSVYDYSISIFGGTYEDAVLTKTSTYGKLTFTYKSLGGVSSSTCWLRGTVTGSDDAIDVDWEM